MLKLSEVIKYQWKASFIKKLKRNYWRAFFCVQMLSSQALRSDVSERNVSESILKEKKNTDEREYVNIYMYCAYMH